MFIFLRLLLAHFIGDFPLQFDSVYKIKCKGPRGVIPHVLIVAAMLILLSWPYLKLVDMWVFIAFVSMTHLFQDQAKMFFKKGRKETFWQYLTDQFLHIAAISIVLLTYFKDLKPPQEAIYPVAKIYNNDLLIVCLILIIVATYNGYYMIETFKNTFFETRHSSTRFEKWYGMIERLAIVLVFLPGGAFLITIPFILCLRVPIYRVVSKYKLNLNKEFISFLEISLSGTVALAAGIALYLM
ncbi:DUF3307 domain-containing protein [Candidatus Omnitrophota bacterium]